MPMSDVKTAGEDKPETVDTHHHDPAAVKPCVPSTMKDWQRDEIHDDAWNGKWQGWAWDQNCWGWDGWGSKGAAWAWDRWEASTDWSAARPTSFYGSETSDGEAMSEPNEGLQRSATNAQDVRAALGRLPTNAEELGKIEEEATDHVQAALEEEFSQLSLRREGHDRTDTQATQNMQQQQQP